MLDITDRKHAENLLRNATRHRRRPQRRRRSHEASPWSSKPPPACPARFGGAYLVDEAHRGARAGLPRGLGARFVEAVRHYPPTSHAPPGPGRTPGIRAGSRKPPGRPGAALGELAGAGRPAGKAQRSSAGRLKPGSHTESDIPESTRHASKPSPAGSAAPWRGPRAARPARKRAALPPDRENIREVFWLSAVEPNAMLYISPLTSRSGAGRAPAPTRRRLVAGGGSPDDRAQVVHSLAEQRAGRSTVEEFRILRPDGALRWILNRGFPIRDDAGQVYRIAGIAEDITERRQTEEERARLQRQLAEAQKLQAVGWSPPASPMISAICSASCGPVWPSCAAATRPRAASPSGPARRAERRRPREALRRSDEPLPALASPTFAFARGRAGPGGSRRRHAIAVVLQPSLPSEGVWWP